MKYYGGNYETVDMKAHNWQKLMDFLPYIKKEIDMLRQMQAIPAPDNPEQHACIELCNKISNKLLAEGKKNKKTNKNLFEKIMLLIFFQILCKAWG